MKSANTPIASSHQPERADPLPQVVRVPDHRQRHADQQADRAGVGAVEDPVGARLRGSKRTIIRSVERKTAGENAEQEPLAPEERHPGGEEQRPEQVELLLDRERPQVPEAATGRPNSWK